MFDHSVAVISDIHGNSLALKAVLNDIKRKGINTILNLGDSLYGPLDPLGTIKLLLENDIQSVKGNEDIIFLEEHTNNPIVEYVLEKLNSSHLKWLETLSQTKVYKDFFLCHASPNQYNVYLTEEVTREAVTLKDPFKLMQELKGIKQKIILCGHSHVPHTIYLVIGKYIINPGSVGLPAFYDDDPYPHVMESGSPHARYSIILLNNENINVENISVSYDWEAAALMALKNGRTDWAGWLRTGRAFL